MAVEITEEGVLVLRDMIRPLAARVASVQRPIMMSFAELLKDLDVVLEACQETKNEKTGTGVNNVLKMTVALNYRLPERKKKGTTQKKPARRRGSGGAGDKPPTIDQP